MSATQSSNPFPKDTWRVTISGQFAEHEIYEKLHKKVKNIARLQEGADILMHKTITQEAAEIFLNQNTIHKFRHYRLALEDIVGDLRNFSCVKGFVKAIRDATIAHDDAFYEADILHQDISVGNIVISEDGTGLLVDWDLCKVMDSASARKRHAIERTGTWQFTAARLLLGKDKEPPHNREDDLESFYHVLNWMALRHTPHSLNSWTLTSELQRIYDYSFRSEDGRAEGGRAKRAELQSGGTNAEANFQNLPLANLLEIVRKLIAVRYQDESDDEAEPLSTDRSRSLANQLQKRHGFTSLFTKALTKDQDWATSGERVDHKLVDLHKSSARETELPELYQAANLPTRRDDDEHVAKRSKQASDDGT